MRHFLQGQGKQETPQVDAEIAEKSHYGWNRATPRLILGYNLGKMRDLLIDTVCPCAYDGNELGFNKNLIKKQHGDAIQ